MNPKISASDQNIAAPKSIIRKLYDWVLHWAETPYGLMALALISFLESSFFPIPPDVLLIALVIATPQRWWVIGLVCTLSSVAGGMLGYGIGLYAWESVGVWIMENIIHAQLVDVDGRLDIPLPSYITNSWGDSLGGDYIFQVYDVWNAWIVGIFGLTPLPYKLVTISAGVAQINVPIFIATSIISRGARFFIVAYILYKIGEPAKVFIDKHFNLLTFIFIFLLVGFFLILKVLF